MCISTEVEMETILRQLTLQKKKSSLQYHSIILYAYIVSN